MAELVMGAIGLGPPLIQMAIKLKSFIEDWKDAPGDIKDILDEISLTAAIMNEEGEIFARVQSSNNFVPDATWEQCLRVCTNALENLNIAVTEAQAKIRKSRTIGSIRAVSRKRVIAKLRERLANARSMLQYLHSQIILRSLLVDNKLLASIKGGSVPVIDEVSLIETTNRLIDTSTSTSLPSPAYSIDTSISKSSSDSASVAPPLSGSSYEFESNLDLKSTMVSSRKQKRSPTFEVAFGIWFTRSIITLGGYGSSWQNIRFARIVRTFPTDHHCELFDYIRDDDAAAVQQMFSEGKASPYDRMLQSNDNTMSLLEMAALYHSLEVCKLLLNEGSPCEELSQGLDMALAFNSISVRKEKSHFEVIRLLGDRTDLDDLFSRPIGPDFRRTIRCSPKSFHWLMQQSRFSFHAWPRERRLDFALRLGSARGQPDFPALMQFVLADGMIDSGACHLEDQNGHTFFFQAAASLGANYAPASRTYERYANSQLESRPTSLSGEDRREYLRLQDRLHHLSQLVTSGSDLHHHQRNIHFSGNSNFSRWVETPFLAVIAEAADEANCSWQHTPDDYYNVLTTFRHKMHITVYLYLTALLAAGVDLQEYGRTEHGIFTNPKNNVFNQYRESWFGRTKTCYVKRTRTYRLVSFEYGPNVADWKFWFVDYVGHDLRQWREFWRGIDRQVGWIPGEWVEDEEEDEWFGDEEEDDD